MADLIIVLTNTPSQTEAQAIADAAVEKSLAAAVQIIGPISSTYRWKDKVEHSQEWMCLLKTSQALYQEVERTIQAIHSYELPGISVIPIIGGSETYFSWYEDQLRG
jgi:periplasmic divalent cation tolerance protein